MTADPRPSPAEAVGQRLLLVDALREEDRHDGQAHHLARDGPVAALCDRSPSLYQIHLEVSCLSFWNENAAEPWPGAPPRPPWPAAAARRPPASPSRA